MSFKVLRWLKVWWSDGRVVVYNATCSPNLSAEADLSWAKLVSWGRVWQKLQNCVKAAEWSVVWTNWVSPFFMQDINTQILHEHPSISSTLGHCINTVTLNQYLNIPLTTKHFIKIWTLHKQGNNVSTPKHWINTRPSHKHPNNISIPKHCINIRTFHEQSNTASAPKLCINTRTLHRHLNNASTT